MFLDENGEVLDSELDPLTAIYAHPLHGRLEEKVVNGVHHYLVVDGCCWSATYVLAWRHREELYYE